SLANASLVGRARAKLQKGDKTGALTDASAVPAGFTHMMTYQDDLANRTRLSNALWRGTVDRSVISVPPYYQTTDPRVLWLPPGKHPYNAWDAAAGPYFIQQKYPGYASSIRLASKLEAEYIAVEASGDIPRQRAVVERERAGLCPPPAGRRRALCAGHRDAVLEAEPREYRGPDLLSAAVRRARQQPEHTVVTRTLGRPVNPPHNSSR